ncbi:MAG: sulfatase-like hydrolase/transferase [Planctomycetes bacterium]|nr:sulfatase-like hydrolase/transferase [Planctomycetota bacterium]
MKLAVVLMVATLVLPIKAKDKPNILWLTCEDNNITYLGCYGNEHAVTPNIDKLAKKGFRYTHAYSNGAVCSASRSTWILGMMSMSTGLLQHRSKKVVPESLTLYPRVLQDAGYYTANKGKMDYNIENYDKNTWGEGGKKKLVWDNLKENQPFFQVLNLNESHESKAMSIKYSTHDPANVKLPPYHPDIEGIRANYAYYYESITNMDEKVGETIAALEKAGLAENTIIVHNSDHGGPLSRGKRFLFNSGTHCPLIVYIPKKFKHLWPKDKPGTTVDRLVSFIDMPPTWISLAGGKIPSHYHGDVFLGKQADEEREYHVSFRGRNDARIENARSIRDKRFLYIKNYIPYVPRSQYAEYQWKVPMQRFWEEHYNAGKANEVQSRYFDLRPKHELYDTQRDPYCLTNLVDNPEFKERVLKMKAQLSKEQRRLYDVAFLPESELEKMAAAKSITVYDVIRRKDMYDIEKYQQIADLALQDDESHVGELSSYLDDKDVAVRYWGSVGLMMLGQRAKEVRGKLEKALSDDSHNVRLMAAWALIKIDKSQKAYDAISAMLNNESYAMLKILNVIDWMGDDGKPFADVLKSMPRQEKMPGKMQSYLIKGQLPFKEKLRSSDKTEKNPKKRKKKKK